MSQAQPLSSAPLNLEALQVLSLSYSAFSDYDDSAAADYTLTEIGFLPEPHSQDASRFRVLFEMKFDRPDPAVNTPYQVHARATAYFITPMPLKGGKIRAPLVVNALTILYGALRGVVMQSTGIALHGSIVLPTLVMSDVVAHAASNDPTIASIVEDSTSFGETAVAPPNRRKPSARKRRERHS